MTANLSGKMLEVWFIFERLSYTVALTKSRKIIYRVSALSETSLI